ncbi:MAG: VWA domain-containing protein [Bryobacterales bacterium]|nr:VWA domain-containing protein [Bryobacterales bacterium]
MLGQESTFRSEVSLVRVEVDVRERSAPVANLKKDDFRIVDEGKVQTVVAVGQEEVPLEIVLLIDTGPNMREIVGKLVAATDSALGELRESDQVAIIVFDAQCKTKTITDFTNDRKSLTSAIQSHLNSGDLYAGTKTVGCAQPLHALNPAAQAIASRAKSNRRRAIIGISDDRGPGTAGRLVREAVHELWNADVVVLSLGLKTDFKEFHIGPPFRGMRFAADQTGGDRVDFEDAPKGLSEAIQRLRSRYSLFYAPPPGKPGEERRISVGLARNAAKEHKNASVRSRTGYVVPSPQSAGTQ